MKRLLLSFGCLFSVSSQAAPWSCDDPVPYCREVSSCKEARFYLEQCGFHRLDRDGDGVPCENVCGKSSKKNKSAKPSKSQKSKSTTKKRKSSKKRK